MNDTGIATIAPLTNVALIYTALERAMNRQSHLPGMVTVYAPSGWGKTFGATYAANKTHGYYVEAKSGWTRKAIVLSILREMGIEPAVTIFEMTEQVSEQLAVSNKPLIIDEADHIVEKKAIELIRDIYEGSAAAIMLIGEERLPTKLRKWERVHGRMLDFVAAQPPSIADAKQLRKFYCKDIEIDDDLLAMVHDKSSASVRRICVNLARIEEEAKAQGLKKIGTKEWGNRELFTGEAQARRI